MKIAIENFEKYLILKVFVTFDIEPLILAWFGSTVSFNLVFKLTINFVR